MSTLAQLERRLQELRTKHATMARFGLTTTALQIERQIKNLETKCKKIAQSTLKP